MSSRFPSHNNSDPRYPRDRSPARSLDNRRPSTQYNDAPSAPRNEGGQRGHEPYSYSARGREPPREPPKGPKADLEGPRGSGYIHRGRGTFLGRGDVRDRDFREFREDPFGRVGRGSGQDRTTRDILDSRDRRPSPMSRDRSRSPGVRDTARDPREFTARDDARRDLRDAHLPALSDPIAYHGRGGLRGRARGEWRGRDDRRGRPPFANEREPGGPRSRSWDRNRDQQIRNDGDYTRNVDSTRREEDLKADREERDDRFRRDQLQRPDSRNSVAGAVTPLTSRSTSSTSVRQSNVDRYTQNIRDHRESLLEHRPGAQGPNLDLRKSMFDKDSERVDVRPRSAGNDRNEHLTASPPPQAPPVPAFGSIPQRAATVRQVSPIKPDPPRDQSSPPVHPSRLNLMGPSTNAPSAPKAQTFSAPTAPKSQQAPERWLSRQALDRPRSLESDLGKPSSQRQPPSGAPEPVRNISRRFSQSRNDFDTSPIRPVVQPSTVGSDSASSIRKAVDEQSRDSDPSPTGSSVTMLKPPLGDRANQKSPVKIPTGPRAERAPPSIRQTVPSLRGGTNRGVPSMMQRPGRGANTWINPALPRNVPRGPSIMKPRVGIATSTEDAVAKWRRDHAPASIITSQSSRVKDPDLKSPPRSASLIQSKDKQAVEHVVQDLGTRRGRSKSQGSASEEDRDDDEADEGAMEDDQIDWVEEDFAKDERKFEEDMQALEARRPPTPRRDPVLLNLLEEVDALHSALEERSAMGGQETDNALHSMSTGLPSPKVDEEDDVDIKQEDLSPLPRIRPETPLVESLPFLVSGIPTPYSEIEDLQQSDPMQTAIQDAIKQQLEEQALNLQTQMDNARQIFVNGFRTWKEYIEDFEALPRAKSGEKDVVPSPAPDETNQYIQAAPVLGRRAKNASELDIQEVLRASQETAAKEEQARREQEPVYVSPETFNPEREAEIPAMLSQEQRINCCFTDTNALVDPDLVLQALVFVPKKDDFSESEHETFLLKYVTYPKRFGFIAESLQGRDYRDCVQHYYLTKLSVKYKDQEAAFLKTRKGKKIAASAMRSQIRSRATGLINSFDGVLDLNSQAIALTEKGRPRRAAAPTFGDLVEAAEAATTPAATPARRGAAGRELLASAERPSVKRTRTKEKGGRKAKAPLLAAAPGPSPLKGVSATSRSLSVEPSPEMGQRLAEIEGAQALAGLGGQIPTGLGYPAGPLSWSAEHQAIPIDTFQQPSQQYGQDPSVQALPKAGPQPTTSSYWSVPEVSDFHNYARYFGSNWPDIATTMKTKTSTMVSPGIVRRICIIALIVWTDQKLLQSENWGRRSWQAIRA